MDRDTLRIRLQKIVESIKTIESVADFNSNQWIRGNASIRRVDKSISTLNVNIKNTEYGVGIDGANKGNVLNFLQNNFALNNKNTLDERYKIPSENIEEVIYYYAEVNLKTIDNQDTKKLKEKNTMIPLNQILYGPPGTGKTYSTVNKALDILLGENHNSNIKSIGELKKEFGSQVEFVTFHQSFSYEDFVEGLKANTNDGNITYEIENGIFKEICKNASTKQIANITIDEENQTLTPEIFEDFYNNFTSDLPNKSEVKSIYSLKTKSQEVSFNLYKNSVGSIVVKSGQQQTEMTISSNELSKVLFDEKKPMYKSYEQVIIDEILKDYNFKKEKIDNTDKNYVLIIDEINRGNISSIFGELITLIEPSKRAGKKEEISLQLPYSKKLFSVPNNVYIIGTMNTADRSLTMMDTALRRRFDFVEKPPNHNLKKISVDCEGVDLQQMLKAINQRIEILYDRDHTIGHAFLMNVDTLDALKNVFQNKILPLLEEYFYSHFEKIKAVLNDKNDNFYTEVTYGEDLFAGYDIDYNSEQKIYKRNNYDDLKQESFAQIYSNKNTSK